MSDVFQPQPVRTLNPGDVKEIMVDATTTSQGAKVDASGNQYAMVSNTSANPVPIQGGNSSAVLTSDAADGPVTPGSVATKSILVGVQFNTALPTLASAQQAAIQSDSSGRILIAQPTASILNATVVSPTAANFNATVVQATAANLNSLAAQGNKGTIGQAWYVQGTDGTNSQAYLSTGEAKVSVTQPLPAGTNVIGSVNQGTSPWITKDQSDGSVTGAAAASFSMLSGGIFNSSLPVLTTGQQAALQTDSSARLLVGSIASALPAGTNLLGGTNVYIGSAIASTTNPVPVVITSNLPGTQVTKYNTTVSLAAAGVANHVYTITTSKTFNGKFFTASGSGKIRADLQTSPDGITYTTFFTQFSSPVFPNIQITLDLLTLSDSGSGSTIRIQITNEDTSAFDVFSTICGLEN